MAVKKINEKIQKWIEDNLYLNKTRYTKALDKYGVLKDGLEDKGYGRVDMQGSFATKTAIKPKQEDEEYDLDMLVSIRVDDDIRRAGFDTFFDAREQLKIYVSEIAKANGWNAKIYENKVGLKIEFPGDLCIDVTPVFKSDQTGNDMYIYRFVGREAERAEPFLLTDALLRENDVNKRNIIMIIKRLIANSCRDSELQILPSIGMAVLQILNIAENNTFSLNTVVSNLDTIIKMKRGDLFNPFLSSEEFYSKNGYAGKWKDLFTVLDSIRITLKKIYDEENFDLFIDMMEKCKLISSNGIEESTGSGGHA